MKTETFDLLQPRDMGKLIGGTFDYIKVNFKELMKVALIMGFPLIVLGSTLVALGAAEFMRDNMNGIDRILLLNEHYMTPHAIGGLICYFTGYVLLSCSVIRFMQIKHEKGGEPVEMSELWSAFFDKGWKLALQLVLVGIMLAIGFMLLLVPGIYLMVPLFIAAPVLIIERQGIFSSIERAFLLVKGRWWSVFGALFVIFLIMIIPASLVSVANTLIFTVDSLGSVDMDISRSTALYAAGGSILMLVRFLLNILFLVLLTITYYSLLEEKEHVSLHQKLDTLGSDHTIHKAEEEY